MREDEIGVQIDRLLVILLRIGELALDEMKLGAVVVNIRVFWVLGEGGFEILLSLVWGTELQIHAGPLDITLGEPGIKLDTLGQIGQSLLMLAFEALECTAKVVSVSLVFTEVSQSQSLLESLGSLLVRWRNLAFHRLQTLLQLALSSLLVQFGVILQPRWPWLGPEALKIVAHKGRAGQSGGLGFEDFLRLGLGKLLQKTLDGLRTLLVPETIDDTAGGDVEESFAVLAEVVVSIRAAVEGLDVLIVEGKSGGGVLNNLFPFAQGVVAGSAVAVVNWVWLAKDGFRVKLNGLVEILLVVGLVTSLLKLSGILLALGFG